MALTNLLATRRSAILEGWLGRVLSTYPDQAASRLRREKDPFQNPVGSNVRRGLEAILEGVLAGTPAEDLVEGIDAVVRIRAIQEFTPSEAVGFLLELKAVLREQAGDALADPASAAELAALDAGVDRVALRGFDQYMACREKLSEIRINEIRNQSHLALRQAGILGREPDPGLPFTAGCLTERGPSE